MRHEEIRAVDPENIVGIGEPSDREAVQVFVKEKKSLENIPAHRQIPDSIDGKPTDVIEVGIIREEGGFVPGTTPYPNRYESFDVMAGGIEIKHGPTSGVLTVATPPLDIDGYEDPVAFTNRHAAPPDKLNKGDPITHKGEKIGEVVEWVEPVHPDDGHTPSDSLVFSIDDPEEWVNRLLGLGELGDIAPKDDIDDFDRVWKSGRTSGLTSSQIISKSADASVKTDVFEGEDATIEFDKVLMAYSFTMGGDSGSLWVREADEAGVWEPVGLHFAGSGVVSMAIPIERIEDIHGWGQGAGSWEPDDDSSGYDPTEPKPDVDVSRVKKIIGSIYDAIKKLLGK